MKANLFLIALVILSFVFSDPILATSTDDGNRVVLNKVKVHNNSGKDVGYIIISASDNPDVLYGIRAKKSDIYHAKATGDANATIKVAECKKINKLSGVCNIYDANTVKNCVKEARFDFYKVKSVKIVALNSCIVECNDGGTTSCLIN